MRLFLVLFVPPSPYTGFQTYLKFTACEDFSFMISTFQAYPCRFLPRVLSFQISLFFFFSFKTFLKLAGKWIALFHYLLYYIYIILSFIRPVLWGFGQFNCAIESWGLWRLPGIQFYLKCHLACLSCFSFFWQIRSALIHKIWGDWNIPCNMTTYEIIYFSSLLNYATWMSDSMLSKRLMHLCFLPYVPYFLNTSHIFLKFIIFKLCNSTFYVYFLFFLFLHSVCTVHCQPLDCHICIYL